MSVGKCPVCDADNAYTLAACHACGARLPWADAVTAPRAAQTPSAVSSPPPIQAAQVAEPEYINPSPVGCLALLGGAIAGFFLLFIAALIAGNYGAWAVVIGTSIWVGFDASGLGVRRGVLRGVSDMSVASWVICCLLLWVIAFPAYLIARPTWVKMKG